MRILLIVEKGPAKGSRWTLRTGDKMVFGRTERADIVIPADSQLSGSHFRISVDADVCTIEDLKSTNGTKVNGNNIESQSLGDGDEIRAGQLIFSLQFESPGKSFRTSRNIDPDSIREAINVQEEGPAADLPPPTPVAEPVRPQANVEPAAPVEPSAPVESPPRAEPPTQAEVGGTSNAADRAPADATSDSRPAEPSAPVAPMSETKQPKPDVRKSTSPQPEPDPDPDRGDVSGDSQPAVDQPASESATAPSGLAAVIDQTPPPSADGNGSAAGDPLDRLVVELRKGDGPLWHGSPARANASPDRVVSLLQKAIPVRLIVNAARGGLDPTALPDAGPSHSKLAGTGGDAAPLSIVAAENLDAERLIHEGWGHDAIVVLVSMVDVETLAGFFDSLGQTGSAIDISSPSSVMAELTAGTELAHDLIDPCEAIIVESAERGWVIFGDQRLIELLESCGIAHFRDLDTDVRSDD